MQNGMATNLVPGTWPGTIAPINQHNDRTALTLPLLLPLIC